MPTRITRDTCLRIRVLNPQRERLGGTVDVEIKPLEGGRTIKIKGANASKDIDVGGLKRGPRERYQVTVTPTSGTASSTTQAITLPLKGIETVEFVIDSGSQPAPHPGRYSLQGILVFDNGSAASGVTLRVYSVGFAGKDAKLGETQSDAQGKYFLSYAPPKASSPNLQVRVLDSAGKELTVSNTKFEAQPSETLNLVAPASIRPLAPELQRLTADLDSSIGGIAKLGQAQEGAARQDLTLLNRATNWDARLLALAATAQQLAATTGVGQDALYALFRVGLPTDPALLATVPADTVQKALAKAVGAGIVGLSEKQIAAATSAFQKFASQTQLALIAPGTVSSYGDLLSAAIPDSSQRAAFAELYFSQPSATDFWAQAAQLGIASKTLDTLKLQGRFLHLTFNNGPLAQKLQKDIGSLDQLSQIAYKDYDRGDTWQTAIKSLAGGGGDQALQKLIPSVYPGNTTADRLAAYSADLARKVRLGFPTEVTARMIERKELAVREGMGAGVASFLKAAATRGYKLGRTPLNTFLKKTAPGLPALDDKTTQSLKTLHRLYQITPSTESLQVALTLGFGSAQEIASYTKDEFMSRYESAFPQGEAVLVYGQAQTVQAVTFNVFAAAQQMDNAPLVYAFSASDDDRQNARNALVQQFPTMESLFGSMDFCDCKDCRSVLSPAAYFVDLMEFLRTSAANPAGYTPLDVLVGKDQTVAGRRPDLAALPLTCENTNTAMPYIDLVNEILEYYIANSHLDANAAYDTGDASTADLVAEPQHILPDVYSGPLKQAVYPCNLPFDLWTETVRGFLGYVNMPLAQVLDVLRPADTLELFTDGNHYPYYRAQILAESLGLSPAEYAVLTVTDLNTQKPSVQNWFTLYGYQKESDALAALPSAKTLSQRLGLTYQELTDLVTTGFANPALYALLFQFTRFGIEMSDAFSYTGQPGYPDWTQAKYQQDKTDFETLLSSIDAEYKSRNPASTFQAIAWLKKLLPANYSKKVLVLADPNSGCDFSATTLQYADGSPATALDYLKLNLFARLWKKLGWTLDEFDRAMQLFFPTSNLPAWGNANFAAAFSASSKTALVYLAHLDALNTKLAPALGRVALLPLWAGLPVLGAAPLYAQLFLASSVLNNDWAFDDPNGQFPTPLSDFAAPPPVLTTLAAHQSAIQGALGLSSDEIDAILDDAGLAVKTVNVVVNGNNVSLPSFTLTNLSILYRYSALAKCLELEVSDLISLKIMSGLDPFEATGLAPISLLADDVLYNQTLTFVKQVATVQASGFTVEDLNYLLRQEFDPVGKYQNDPNALMSLVQTLAGGLRQIQAQNAVPPNLTSMAESLIDQTLSGLFPAAMLKSLFSVLTDAQTYTASQGGVAPANAIDPAPFAQETALGFAYDAVSQTQTVTYKGLLLDWKKSQLEQINASGLFSGLLDQLQQAAQDILVQRIGDVLGVWASLVEYEAVKTGVANALPAATLMPVDSALDLSYDQADKLQWLGYRGVLTDAKKKLLTAVPLAAPLAALLSGLLNDVQQQSAGAYGELVGSILAMRINVQTYVASQAVAPANQIDPSAFSDALVAAQQAGIITAPVPTIEFDYDASSQVQTLSCTGVLTDSMRIQLAKLLPSAVLGTLLQAVRNQALQLFQDVAANLLTVSAPDLDNFSQPFLGLDASKQPKQVKAELVRAFLPLLAQKLSRQLVLQTLSSNLGSDPSLTEALVSDAALLADPTDPGKSLLGAFLALGQQGVSAAYYTSTDGSGNPQASGLAATTDAADPTNSKPGTASTHFEGFLQVPTDGPYRFFAELGDAGAAASLRIDSPDPTVLFDNPIISPTSKATKPGDEVSQFVQLKGGVAYHFALDFSNLGAHGASLLIQGESLPKGPLSQVVLYAQESVNDFARAKTLLAKVLQILQVTGLDEREISYLVANADDFSDLELSALPTQPSDDSPAKAALLFSQFLALADYADLRAGPAGDSDGLIDVFQAAAQGSPQEPNTPWTLLANLTRRDPQVVQDVAAALGADPHFSNNVGIRRIWDALQLVQTVGIPVASLAASTLIASPTPSTDPTPNQIATDFKNSVKAQYTTDQWRPIAQSVFDPLRKKKRDALVAYLLNELTLDDSNQLFEYFLVDPGMEPVVQTSRIRLAMSSVQTFIQRCLLNLENGNATPALDVSPSAIDADWWDWMKRYRVWQANREIFLFPENWMEPELRLDKTDLFQALESTLLQGDVTVDLVEDALMTYLKGLDVRARLDIVATYLDQNLTDAGLSTLHVLGRTYSQPHKYFYRTYSTGTWSGWVAVTPDIQGDHIVLAVWRGRLNVFWATFIAQPQAQQGSPDTSHDSQGVGSLPFSTLASAVLSAKAQQQYKVQLHWSEYFQGKWTDPIATDVSRSDSVAVDDQFDPRMVYIRVLKETASDGSEGAVRILLDFPEAHIMDPDFAVAIANWKNYGKLGKHYPRPQPTYTFRITSKNCDPMLFSDFLDSAPPNPYNATDVDATFFTGSAEVSASFQSTIGDGSPPTSEKILKSVNQYALLECGNPVLPSPFLDANDPVYQGTNAYQEAGALVAPFFFKDTADSSTNNELTFFVQPTLTENTVVQPIRWAIPPSLPPENWADPNLLGQIDVIAQVPPAIPINPGDPVYSVFPLQDTTDWLMNAGTAVAYGDAAIGKTGGIVEQTGSMLSGGGIGALGGVGGVAVGGVAAGGIAGGVAVGGVAAGGIAVGVANATAGVSAAALSRGLLGSSGAVTIVGRQGLSLNQLRAIRARRGASSIANPAASSTRQTS
jgi:ABC toxin-like protein/neuraminidase-like protein/virulence plasmid A protein